MDILLYAALLTLVVVAFLVLIHLHTKEALRRCHEAWRLAAHAHDDALQRIAQDRAWSTTHIKALTSWGEQLVRTQQELMRQLTASASREITEVQRYMEVMRQDLISAVTNAACDGANRTRPLPAATPPHINQPNVTRPPVSPQAGKKEEGN